jgi:hypothetical protein
MHDYIIITSHKQIGKRQDMQYGISQHFPSLPTISFAQLPTLKLPQFEINLPIIRLPFYQS